MPIDGVPHPRAGDFFKKTPSGGKGKGCTVTLLGLLSAPWLLDLLLAGSRAAA
jgi:hypothetical protein